MKKKDVSTINNLVCYESDEHADTISDSSKPVDASNEPITDTHIVEGINNLLVGIISVKPDIIGAGIIGQVITQGVINGSTNIGSNIVRDNVASNVRAPVNNDLGDALSNDSDSDDGWIDTYDSN